ncbi:MAG TPA: signal peptidase II [Patescibacteria group bacterium]|nr:signal peptidase II [Patescibacteria group bacterium]
MTEEAPPATSSGRMDGRPSAADAVASHRQRWPLFVALAAAVVVADQLTKALVTGSLGPGGSVDVIGETVRIVFGQNSGALFGLFKDNAAMFGLVSIVVVGLIVAYHARAAGTLYLTVTLGMLLGGAIGNMVDRLRLGYVVDFVDVGIGSLRFYTFNVADSAISLAILMLFIAAIRPWLVEGPGQPSPAVDARAQASALDDDWADDERHDAAGPR